MQDPFKPLVSIAHEGTTAVAKITRYLSTLPQPVEVVEELVAVSAVTTSLLETLHTAICSFESTEKLCSHTSFIKPLCHDVGVMIEHLTRKVSEAQKLRVFEPNDVGLVRVPRNAWVFVLGSEAKLGQFRSRLYVEKYRARVLIDAVTWFGLKNLGSSRTTVQDSDFEALNKMLPLIADRVVGIWRDYQPRLGSGNRSLGNSKIPLQHPAAKMQQRAWHVATAPKKQEDFSKDSQAMDEKLALQSSSSSTSLASYCSGASSVTIADDSIKERWILRRSEARRVLTSRTNILGVPFQSTYDYTPAHYYVQPLSSHASEIDALLISQSTPATKAILALSDDAQREVQGLLESRQNASSTESVLRSWEVLAFQARPRRKIAATSGSKKWWQVGRKPTGPLEWVLVIKGETTDRKIRRTPIRSEDPWNPKPRNTIPPALANSTPAMPNPYVVQAQQQQMLMANRLAMPLAPGAHVLRHVEQKRGLSMEEAEHRMTQILGDLFKFRDQDTDNTVATDDRIVSPPKQLLVSTSSQDELCKEENPPHTSDS